MISVERNNLKKFFKNLRSQNNDELNDDKIITIYLTSKNNLLELQEQILKYNSLISSARLRLKQNLLYDLNAIDIESKNVISLNLSTLGLSTLPSLLIQDFTGLKSINLAKNKLSELPHNFLLNLNKLEKLDLSNNCIKSLKWSDFENLHNLKDLYLNDNPLSDEFKEKIALFNLLYLPKLRIHF